MENRNKANKNGIMPIFFIKFPTKSRNSLMDFMEESALENPVVAQLVEKFLACFGDRMFIHEPTKFSALYNIS
jgi:hypothetical protein